MKEGLDPELVKKWDQKLVEAGLPGEKAVGKRQKIRAEGLSARAIDERGMSSKEMEAIWANLEKLPPKLKWDILEDMKKMRNAKYSYEEIVDRFTTLIREGHKLMELSDTDSDKFYTPPPMPKEKADKEREKEIARNIDALIAQVEKTLEEDRVDDQLFGETIN